jgi:hypothetical protein
MFARYARVALTVALKGIHNLCFLNLARKLTPMRLQSDFMSVLLRDIQVKYNARVSVIDRYQIFSY